MSPSLGAASVGVGDVNGVSVGVTVNAPVGVCIGGKGVAVATAFADNGEQDTNKTIDAIKKNFDCILSYFRLSKRIFFAELSIFRRVEQLSYVNNLPEKIKKLNAIKWNVIKMDAACQPQPLSFNNRLPL